MTARLEFSLFDGTEELSFSLLSSLVFPLQRFGQQRVAKKMSPILPKSPFRQEGGWVPRSSRPEEPRALFQRVECN